MVALAAITGRPAKADRRRLRDVPRLPHGTHRRVALHRPAPLCIDACPVDAILAARSRCTSCSRNLCSGCERCIAPARVDCIVMHPATTPWRVDDAAAARSRYAARIERLARASESPTGARDGASLDPPRRAPATVAAAMERRRPRLARRCAAARHLTMAHACTHAHRRALRGRIAMSALPRGADFSAQLDGRWTTRSGGLRGALSRGPAAVPSGGLARSVEIATADRPRAGPAAQFDGPTPPSTRSRPISCASTARAASVAARARAAVQFVDRPPAVRCSARPPRSRPRAGRPGDAFYEIDALHMLGIARPLPERLDWNLRALEVARALDGGRAPAAGVRPLDTTKSAGRTSTAASTPVRLGYWEKSLAVREGPATSQRTRIARGRWRAGIGALGRLDDAERMQRDLAEDNRAAGEEDGYVYRNWPELRIARGMPPRGATRSEGLCAAPRGRLGSPQRNPRASNAREIGAGEAPGPARAESRDAADPARDLERLGARERPTRRPSSATRRRSSCWSRSCLSRRPPTGVTGHGKAVPVANTPAAIARLGVDGLIPYVSSIGLYRNKAKHLVAASEIIERDHGGGCPKRAKPSSACGRGRRRRTSCSTPRSGSRRSRSTRTSSGLPTHGPRARQGRAGGRARPRGKRPGRIPPQRAPC